MANRPSDSVTLFLYNILKSIFSLGGPGHVVQIDESLVARRKYNHGRHLRNQWVFGLQLVDVHSGIGIIRLVPNRDRATLLPIIQEVVLPGNTIHSDYWGHICTELFPPFL